MRKLLPLLSLLFCAAAIAAEAPAKIVIAHRGASGYLPEHTLEAKVLAYAQGADYLEQDVVMTKDDQLVIIHDLTLERTTDVAKQFPGRARKDGSYYVIDFTLNELRQLQVSEGNTAGIANFPARFPPNQSPFGIHTLQEELELIAGLEKSAGRKVGIYPELKSPWFHHQEGKDLATATLNVLKAYGYASKDAPVFVQSFEYIELVRVHNEVLPDLGMNVKLVQLIAENDWQETFEQQDGEWVPYDYSWMHKAEGLKKLSTIVDGIGPSYSMLVNENKQTGKVEVLPMTAAAHAAGLQIHPYTFRRDNGQLPPYAKSFDELLDYFLFTVDVDGVFTDYPDLAVHFLQERQERK